MTIDRTVATARIQALLEGITSPSFVDVFQGEPLGLPPGGPYACWWYTGDQDAEVGRQTLGNVMVDEVFRIAVFWPRVVERTVLPSQEADIWAVSRKVQTAFIGDSTLNDTATSGVTSLEIRTRGVDFGAFPLDPRPQIYRVLEFELRLEDLNAESVAA